MFKLRDFWFKPADRDEDLVNAANVGLAPTASNAAPNCGPDAGPAATRAINLPKHVRNGEKSVHFHCNREWEEYSNAKVGHSTKKLFFGSGFLFTT